MPPKPPPLPLPSQLPTLLSGSEDLLELGPIIKRIHVTKQHDAFLRGLEKEVVEREGEIEGVCRENYQEFISSVEKLLKVRQGTVNLKVRAMSLNEDIQKSGAVLAAKRKELLDAKKVAQNLDETIETLQACLRVLDLNNKVTKLIEDRQYFAALKALDSLALTSQIPILPAHFLTQILSTLPASKNLIKTSVLKEMKTWLFDIREIEAEVGKKSFEGMDLRIRRWKVRLAKDIEKGGAGQSAGKGPGVGSSLELTVSERHEYDVIDNAQVKVDFKPLLQCIHIYDSMDSVEELQLNYQSDRRAQSALILSQSTTFSLASLTQLLSQIIGFFVIESHVIRETSYPIPFRSETEVEDLWEGMLEKTVEFVKQGLNTCEDLEIYLGVKKKVEGFVMILEGLGYSVAQLNSLLYTLFERYAALLHRYFRSTFQKIVASDDYQPLEVEGAEDFEIVLKTCWFPRGGEWSIEDLREMATSKQRYRFPFSKTYYDSCQQIRRFVDEYYRFAEGINVHDRDIDEVLRKAIDLLLIEQVSNEINKRASLAANKLSVSQLAQIIINVLFFEVACEELEGVLVTLKSTQRGSTTLQSLTSFNITLDHAKQLILQSICQKLDNLDFPQYDWVSWVAPSEAEGEATPSEEMNGMIAYLKTVMDSNFDILGEQGGVKEGVWRGAIQHVAEGLMSYLSEREPLKMSHYGLGWLAVDVRYLVSQATELGFEGENTGFVLEELSQTVDVLLSPNMLEFLTPEFKSSFWPAVNPKVVQSVLIKVRPFSSSSCGEIEF
ncbi:exocyst complex subunit Sec15-like protein [Atractiella rhizophila]|nr:exocyst complex subunit Sec15-like protein [Atractiella rhizophila]